MTDSELQRIVLTACFTILGGVTIFVVGQILQRFVLDPIQAQKKTIGEIAFVLTYYRNMDYLSSTEEKHEAKKVLRRLAAELRQSLAVIPVYRMLSFFRLVRKRRALIEASYDLVGWSNSLFNQTESAQSKERLQKIADVLNITLNYPRSDDI